jgi:hypothetical protein
MKDNKEIFVVSWADWDGNEDNMTSGTFTDIFSTYEAARKAVEDAIDQTVADDMYAFDESDYEDVYGTKDKAEIKRKFIRTDTHDFIVVQNPNTDYENQYTITRYSLEFLK